MAVHSTETQWQGFVMRSQAKARRWNSTAKLGNGDAKRSLAMQRQCEALRSREEQRHGMATRSAATAQRGGAGQ